MHPSGQWLYVNETFARRLSRFALHADGSLGAKEVVTEFGPGTFPDGLAFDEEGHAWVVSIVSNRLIRVAPDGTPTTWLEEADAAHLARVEAAFEAGTMGRPHLDGAPSRSLRNISSIAFCGRRPPHAPCSAACSAIAWPRCACRWPASHRRTGTTHERHRNAPRRLSLVDEAYEQIRRRILDNVWPPGHRALEQEVALALGMSRTPVREALMRLQNEGLVEVDPAPRHARAAGVADRHARDLPDPDRAGMHGRRTAGRAQAQRQGTGAAGRCHQGDGQGAEGRRPGRLGRGRRALPRAAGRSGRQPPAAGHGAELLGPRAPRAHVHAAPAAQAGELDQGAHADGRAAARRRCRRRRGASPARTASAPTASWSTIFEHFKLAQM